MAPTRSYAVGRRGVTPLHRGTRGASDVLKRVDQVRRAPPTMPEPWADSNRRNQGSTRAETRTPAPAKAESGRSTLPFYVVGMADWLSNLVVGSEGVVGGENAGVEGGGGATGAGPGGVIARGVRGSLGGPEGVATGQKRVQPHDAVSRLRPQALLRLGVGAWRRRATVAGVELEVGSRSPRRASPTGCCLASSARR